MKNYFDSMTTVTTNKPFILFGFVIIKFLLQYILLSPEYDLHRDEYLHLDQADHLAWGYLSVPPVTSWISFMIKLLGNGIFWVKFFPAVFGALTIVVVWKTIEELKGNLFALILGATCMLFSVLLRLNTLFQPNSLDVLCWVTFCFVIIKVINSGDRKWFIAGAVVFAFGFLNKYNMAFLIAGIFPAILLTRQRQLLYTRSFGMSLFIAVLLILPNLLWQYNHGFPVVGHMEELARTQLVNVDRVSFFKSQLLFYIGSMLVIIGGLYALMFYEPFKPYRLFFWSFFFTLIIFVSLRAKDYYTIGLYPVYIAFGSVYLEKVLEAGNRRYFRPVLLVLPIVFFILIFNVAFPNKTPEYILQNSQTYKDLGLLRWEDGKDHQLPQDFADMLGWKELAQKVDMAYASLPDSRQTLVLCDNYGQAGAINYYSKKGIKAVSFNADYLNWFELDEPYTSLIRVKTAGADSDEMKESSPYFLNSAVVDSVENQFAREYGTSIYVFRGAKVDIRHRIRQEIREVKGILGEPD